MARDCAASSGKYKRKRKRLVFELLGNCCRHCGFTDARALQIDHIAGQGGATRHLGYSLRYALITAHPERFQLLCANCNWIKRSGNQRERGGKPTHRREIVAAPPSAMPDAKAQHLLAAMYGD